MVLKRFLRGCFKGFVGFQWFSNSALVVSRVIFSFPRAFEGCFRVLFRVF